jgi:predicted GTPase
VIGPDAVQRWNDGATPGLKTVARLAHEVGLSALAGEAERSIERIAGGRFHVACVGQFKRGKSTLLNALIWKTASVRTTRSQRPAAVCLRAGP